MRLNKVKHLPITFVPNMSGGVNCNTVLGNTVIGKLFNGNYSIFHYSKGTYNQNFIRDDNGIIKEFSNLQQAKDLIIQLSNAELQKSLNWICTEHKTNLEGTD